MNIPAVPVLTMSDARPDLLPIDADLTDQGFLTALVGLVYEGLLEPVPWFSILDWVRRRVTSNATGLVLRPASMEEPAFAINSNSRGTRISSNVYGSFYYYSLDTFRHLPPDQVLTVEEWLGEETYLNGDFYNEYYLPRDIRYVMGADIYTDDETECRIRVCRAPDVGPFSAENKALLQLLVPHFKRAVQLYFRLCQIDTERKLYANTLNQIRLGSILLDDAGKIMTCNEVAAEILSRRDGIWEQEGSLQVSPTTQGRRLQVLLDKALEDRKRPTPSVTEAVFMPRKAGHQNLSVLIKSIPRVERGDGKRRPAVEVFLRDPEQRAPPSRDTLSKLFKLTPAEAALCASLAAGNNINEACSALGITRNTAKSRLKSIFGKTGATRQSHLVSILLDTIATL